MASPSRGRSTLDTLRSAMSLYARRPLMWLLLLSPAFLTAWLRSLIVASGRPELLEVQTLVTTLVWLVGQGIALFTGWTLVIMMTREALGQRLGMRESGRHVLARLGPAFTIGVLLPVLGMLGLILATMLLSAPFGFLSNWNTMLRLAAIPIAIYFSIRFSFSLQEGLLREGSVSEAMRRSWRATQGSTIKICLVLMIITSIPMLLAALPALVVFASMGSALLGPIAWISSLTIWLITPLGSAAWVHLWLELSDGAREALATPPVSSGSTWPGGGTA